MEITKLTAFIFSPTGTTAAVAKPLAEALLSGARIVDLTCADAEEERFGPDELVLFAAPVYGGRIPAPAAKRFARMKGEGTPRCSSRSMATGTMTTRCSSSAISRRKTAFARRGRGPSSPSTRSSVRSRAAVPTRRIWRRSGRSPGWRGRSSQGRQGRGQFGPLAVKGNRPYREFSGVPLKPQADRKCVKCGACAENCPAGAIPADDPSKTDNSRCISCMRCVKVCPAGRAGERPHAVGWRKAVREEKQPAPGTRVVL